MRLLIIIFTEIATDFSGFLKFRNVHQILYIFFTNYQLELYLTMHYVCMH